MPFYHRVVNVIYQHMLYLEPGFLYRGIGIKLLSVTMKDLLGGCGHSKELSVFAVHKSP
jgi:hypothetical protein